MGLVTKISVILDVLLLIVLVIGINAAMIVVFGYFYYDIASLYGYTPLSILLMVGMTIPLLWVIVSINFLIYAKGEEGKMQCRNQFYTPPPRRGCPNENLVLKDIKFSDGTNAYTHRMKYLEQLRIEGKGNEGN